MKFYPKVNSNSDDLYADYADVDIDTKMYLRILQLQKIVTENDLYQATEWDCIDLVKGDLEDKDEEKEEVDAECIRLCVEKDEFQWEGFFRHTNETWETAPISIECLKVAMCPTDKLPLLMNDLTREDAKETLRKRLKEGA